MKEGFIQGVVILAGVASLFVLYCYGYVNIVDRVALFLHRHADVVRRRHMSHERELNRMWNSGPVSISKEKLG
jgi:hypothetical protein